MNNQQQGLKLSLGDVSDLKPTGFGFEALEDGGYAARIVRYGNVGKKSGPGQQFQVDVVLTERGFEGIERSLYLQYPAENVQGMSEEDIRNHVTFPKRNWLAFASSIGYPDEVIAANAKNLEITEDVIRNAPGNGTCVIGVRVVEEEVLDKYGKGTGRFRENENRNFITRSDYEKHSITRKLAAKQQASGAAQQPHQPQAPSTGLGGGAPAPTRGAFGGGMPSPMGGAPNGAPAPSAGLGLAGSMGARPPA